MPNAIVQLLNKLRARATLGQQVALVSALLCVALVVTVAATAALVARQQATARVETAMVSIASSVAQRLDAYMFERFREIRNIAGLDALRTTWAGDPAGIRSVLEQLQSTLPDYAWIGFALSDGSVKAATSSMLEGVSVAERPWFKAGSLGPTVQDVHDAKLLAELLGPSPNNEPFRFVDVAVPVTNETGQTIGVIGAHMSWSWASVVSTAVQQLLDPALRTEIWVLDANGRVLLGPEFGTQPVGAETISSINGLGQLSFTDALDGGHILGAVTAAGHQDYSGLGWIVVARRPLNLALGAANQLTFTIALIGAAFALLGTMAAFILAHRLTNPLKQLAESIDRIGRDPGETMIARSNSSRDLSQLSVAIRSLLRRLGTAETAQESAQREAAANKQLLAEKTERLGEDINALQILADTDPLTGMLNRRAFRVFGVDAMNYFRRHRRDLGILVIDIDYFKRVNDTYGHSVGDDVIQAIGRIVQQEARTIDKVARFGGEEFVVLMRETEREGPAILADRIREKIASQLISHPGHGTIHVTVSIGASMAMTSDRDIEDVIERADRALYEAKRRGRNCTVVAETGAVIAVVAAQAA